MSPKPLPAPVTHKELPTHQYVMDWNPDFPESIVKERKIPSKAAILILIQSNRHIKIRVLTTGLCSYSIFSFPFQFSIKIMFRKCFLIIKMFYLNTIEQLILFVEQLDQLEICLPFSRLLTGIPILAVLQNLRWNSNKTSLIFLVLWSSIYNLDYWFYYDKQNNSGDYKTN